MLSDWPPSLSAERLDGSFSYFIYHYTPAVSVMQAQVKPPFLFSFVL
jgi:hypothetical protein